MVAAGDGLGPVIVPEEDTAQVDPTDMTFKGADHIVSMKKSKAMHIYKDKKEV